MKNICTIILITIHYLYNNGQYEGKYSLETSSGMLSVLEASPAAASGSVLMDESESLATRPRLDTSLAVATLAVRKVTADRLDWSSEDLTLSVLGSLKNEFQNL